MKLKYADKMDDWIRLYNDGHSLREIGRLKGIDAKTISTYFKIYGVDLRSGFDQYLNEWSQLQSEVSLREIARRYKTSVNTVSYVLKKGGIKPRGRRIFKFNENFFENINIQNAYWLGLIAADGNIHLRKDGVSVFEIKLHLDDIELLEKFSESIGLNKPVEVRDNFCRVRFDSRLFCDGLRKLGVTESKSLTFTLPDIPRDYFKSFILGYFDGDGCITHKGNRAYFYITGTYEFLNAVQSYIINELGLNQTKLQKDINSEIYSLVYSGRRQVVKILEWLYDEQPVFMERKHKIYTDVKREVGNITNLSFHDTLKIFEMISRIGDESYNKLGNKLYDQLHDNEKKYIKTKYNDVLN